MVFSERTDFRSDSVSFHWQLFRFSRSFDFLTDAESHVFNVFGDSGKCGSTTRRTDTNLKRFGRNLKKHLLPIRHAMVVHGDID